MIVPILFVVACSAPLALGGTVAQSNHFIDVLLGDIIKGQTRAYHLNGVSVPNFQLEKIKSNSLTNRDIKGNFTEGFVRGLTDIRRAGDCSPTAWIGGNITLSCKVDVNAVYVEWKLSVKGHTLSGNIQKLPAKAQLKGSTAILELSAFPNRPITLRTFHVDQVKFKIEMEDLGLNDQRKKNLYDQIEKKATVELFDALYNQYSKALSAALNGLVLPPV